MAEQDLIDRLRRMTGETEDNEGYTDTQLATILNENGNNLNSAAAVIWAEKASDYADLVNISEAGSSRSNSDLFKHASDQADRFQRLADAEDPVAAATAFSTTRRIERV